MLNDEKKDKVKKITDFVRDQIFSLISARKTGKIELTLELNLSQGGIGETFFKLISKEKI